MKNADGSLNFFREQFENHRSKVILLVPRGTLNPSQSSDWDLDSGLSPADRRGALRPGRSSPTQLQAARGWYRAPSWCPRTCRNPALIMLASQLRGTLPSAWPQPLSLSLPCRGPSPLSTSWPFGLRQKQVIIGAEWGQRHPGTQGEGPSPKGGSGTTSQSQILIYILYKRTNS